MRVFCICHRETGELLGQLSLYALVRGELQSCSLGYWIGKPHARKGYMTEAVGLAVRHAFTILGLHRVEVSIMTTNAASIALARRCGFRFEGVSKRYFRIRGRFRDHERWAITIEDLRRRGSARSSSP
jgi:ribosomal-protein-alanine N-acetyltransferase